MPGYLELGCGSLHAKGVGVAGAAKEAVEEGGVARWTEGPRRLMPEVCVYAVLRPLRTAVDTRHAINITSQKLEARCAQTQSSVAKAGTAFWPLMCSAGHNWLRHILFGH